MYEFKITVWQAYSTFSNFTTLISESVLVSLECTKNKRNDKILRKTMALSVSGTHLLTGINTKLHLK